ncbi:MAG TPA: tripartite tricarboxylate transporter substrate binding protein [Burkholderiaceae bacterium]|nr:tripartite tricarboxylate transporter substrate binding protein [Burkholderiaceae bacterium]
MKQLHRMLAAFALSAVAGAAGAQDFPNRPITLVQGFGVGGNADTVARLIAAEMQPGLGQPVVVEARTGAGGNIASNHVAKSKPDGYTLILLTGGHAVSAALYRSLPFDPIKDFDMISTATFFPFVIAVRPDHPAKDLKDLLDRARQKPQGVSFSSVGIGSTQHMTGGLLGLTAGVQLLHVPYRGGAAPLQGVVGGDVDLLIDTMTVALPHIQAGRLRALAVTSAEPWPALPGVPPVGATLPGFEVRSWLGVAAPRGLPPDVLQRLNKEARRAIDSPEVKSRVATLGSVATSSTPEEMTAMVQREVARWKRVVAEAKVPQQD